MTISPIPLIGYADKLSVRPGETIQFKVSAHGPEPYRAELVRIISGDPNPDSPGIKEEEVQADFAGAYSARVQAVHKGSYVRIVAPDTFNQLDSFTLTAVIWPTLPALPGQAVISRMDASAGDGGGAGFVLASGPDGAELTIGQAVGPPVRLSTGIPFRERYWFRIWASYDAANGKLEVGQQPLDPSVPPHWGGTATAETAPGISLETTAPLLIAATGGTVPTGHFNGKIERPRIFDQALSVNEFDRTVPFGDWDFSQDIPTMTAKDVGPNALNGQLINGPARAMTGSNWTGREMCWRHTPDQYGAIHFHEDDLVDCGWETDFTFTVPADLKSGVYAAKLTSGAHWEKVPFVVCPPKGEQQADLCVIIPTFTYVIYHNQARPEFGDFWKERAADWGAFPWNPKEHPEFGLSTYNLHSDGSGICHASWHRPMLNVRPGYFPIPDMKGSGLRHFPADTHLLDWLEEKGIGFDVVTDWEVHHEGAELLAPYKAVTTCSHPEYHTEETLDALTGYRDGGGKLLYLGGNGFYWRVAIHSEVDGLIEIRRGEDGLRAWAAEPGEYFNAFDGAYGGIWRRQGRAPQKLCGVGFTSQGHFEGTYYRKAPGAADPAASWILDGVTGDTFGDFGLSGGGAAGYELDRVDPRQGTPENAVVIAVSENVQDHFILVPEEVLTHVSTVTGEAPEDLIRSDMTYFDCPGGGAVFSVGSITFCGSLSHNNYDNDISRIIENVLNRFLG